MNELIKINQNSLNGHLIQTVNARDLHGFLEVKSRFATWIQNRIADFDFKEGKDFCTISKNLENGGRTIEYFLSLTMAKELSMVERNEKGKEARRYFIKCEEIAKAKIVQLPDFTNPVIAARAWADEVEKNLRLTNQLKTCEPDIQFAKEVRESDVEILISRAAKLLNVPVKFLFNFMRQDGWIFVRTSEPRAETITRGLMTVKFHRYYDSNGNYNETPTGLITGKGLERLHTRLKSRGLISQEHRLQLGINWQ